jgi:hypothetical protein
MLMYNKQIKAHPWSKVFSKRMPEDALSLVALFLQVRASSSFYVISEHTLKHSSRVYELLVN